MVHNCHQPGIPPDRFLMLRSELTLVSVTDTQAQVSIDVVFVRSQLQPLMLNYSLDQRSFKEKDLCRSESAISRLKRSFELTQCP
jgi:hypothetical protein